MAPRWAALILGMLLLAGGCGRTAAPDKPAAGAPAVTPAAEAAPAQGTAPTAGAPAAQAAPAFAFDSAPTRNGPWTPVGRGGLVPPAHTWVRIRYAQPMEPWTGSVISSRTYGSNVLPGEWEGNQAEYVFIGDAPPVLYLAALKGTSGQSLRWGGLDRLYRGDPPALYRQAPGNSKGQNVHSFTGEPFLLSYRDGKVEFTEDELAGGADQRQFQQIDPTSGRVTVGLQPADAPPYPKPEPYRFPSPDGKLIAELIWGRQPLVGGGPYAAALEIAEKATGKVLLHIPQWLKSLGSDGCGNAAPGFAWQPDSQAVAALDAPDEERLVLKVTTLQGESRLMAEQKSGYWSQFDLQVAWSPSGKLIAAGTQLVEAATGKVLATELTNHLFWSADSRYLLLYQNDHPFTQWGTVDVLTVTTGKRQRLGDGVGLGWTPLGEVVWVRWDNGRKIEPPGKGCP